MNRKELKKAWRVVKENGKLFKKKYWDNLTYEQMKICTPYWDFMGVGILTINKNKEKFKKEVIENGLNDYVFGIEMCNTQKRGIQSQGRNE